MYSSKLRTKRRAIQVSPTVVSDFHNLSGCRAETGLVVTERRIPVEGSEEGILARFYTPETTDESETFPIVVDFHGVYPVVPPPPSRCLIFG